MKKVLLVFLSLLLLSSLCYGKEATTDKVTANEVIEPVTIESDRFNYLLSDNSFDYFFDKKTILLNNHPYLKEQVIDVWLKEVNNDEFEADTGYVMKHYYFRVKEQQVILLEEAEFTLDGRLIDNSVKAFTDARWENLIPGTTIEKCYQLTVNYAQNNKINKVEVKVKKQQDLYDMLSTIII